jgi:hypothetical protein
LGYLHTGVPAVEAPCEAFFARCLCWHRSNGRHRRICRERSCWYREFRRVGAAEPNKKEDQNDSNRHHSEYESGWGSNHRSTIQVLRLHRERSKYWCGLHSPVVAAILKGMAPTFAGTTEFSSGGDYLPCAFFHSSYSDRASSLSG